MPQPTIWVKPRPSVARAVEKASFLPSTPAYDRRSVGPDQRQRCSSVLAERHFERAVFQEAPHGILGLGVTSQEIHRFGKHGLTWEEGSLQFLDVPDSPSMMAFCPVEKRDQWTVSTMTGIAAEAREMLRIARQVGNPRGHHATSPLHQNRHLGLWQFARLAFRARVPDVPLLARATSGHAMQLQRWPADSSSVGQIDRRLHWRSPSFAVKQYSNIYGASMIRPALPALQ